MSTRARVLLGTGLVLTLAAAGKLALDARDAQGALQHAEVGLAGLRTAAAEGDEQRTAAALRSLQADAATAHRATSGRLWQVTARVPLLGRTASSAATLARTVDAVATDVLPGLLAATTPLRAVAKGSGSAVDLTAVGRAAPALELALRRVQVVDHELHRSPSSLVLPQVRSARSRVVSAVDRLTGDLTSLSEGARLVPEMLGGSGVRRYFVGFQNNAEARGTGGLLGAYAIVAADHGRVRVERLGSDRDLEGLPAPRVDLSADYRRLYGQDLVAWQNANLSGDFPSVAPLWVDMWQRRFGQHLDGAVAADPLALSRLLTVTGPIPLPGGGVLSASTVVRDTESSPYARFAGQEVARKDYLLVSARAVLDRVLGDRSPSRYELGRAVAGAAAARSVMVWSAHPQEQAWIAGSAASGAVPDTARPFAFVVVNNTAGNKIDYYLDRRVTYDLAPCRHGLRTSVVTVQLRNDLPVSRTLPSVVVGRLDRPAGQAVRGSTSLLVSAYVTRGAALRRATLDGAPVGAFAGRERGHPVFLLRVELPPRQTRTLVLHLEEPAWPGTPDVLVQSLVRPQATSVRGSACG